MKKVFGICSLCGQKENLVQSHIIPKSLVMALKSNPSEQLYVNKKVSNSGIFDLGILCQECDNSFSVYEKELKKLLFLDIEKYKQTLYDDKAKMKADYYFIPNDDISILRVFLALISILWRCSISKRPELNKIELGPWETIFKEALKTKKIPKGVELVIGLLKEEKNSPSGIHTSIYPSKYRDKGINYYDFWYNGYDFRIKVDKRMGPYRNVANTCDSNGLIIIDGGYFIQSNIRKALVKMTLKT